MKQRYGLVVLCSLPRVFDGVGFQELFEANHDELASVFEETNDKKRIETIVAEACREEDYVALMKILKSPRCKDVWRALAARFGTPGCNQIPLLIPIWFREAGDIIAALIDEVDHNAKIVGKYYRVYDLFAITLIGRMGTSLVRKYLYVN